MSDEVLKNKVAGIIHTSERDSKGSRKSSQKGIISRIGAYFSSHWVYSVALSPIILIVCIGLLFSIKGKGGKEK